ncbi:NAD(P)H-dependent oxidoreductase [Streptomyces sp. DSM 44915]|uniref:NAD(P)H-dependent oxidoreductase n=1 Tax=Streptomyces chisholmiae TaxID=3075540 RepID=A0ABU2JZF1_9ACTN|nr:NAD(P)H-dependent oxidoreductase [Streptomyces sp. DSM 44915]MDT0270141.1 NAD(P)H-dependent oxidoreductase [Streptomyces sp. DSM 44915]
MSTAIDVPGSGIPTSDPVGDSTPAGDSTTGVEPAGAGSAEAGRPVRITVILGSVRDGRFLPTVADWFTERVAERAAGRGDVLVDRLDLAEVPLPLDMAAPDGGSSPEVGAALAAAARRLAEADAFVVITPEYNHSFPAALKNLVDWHFAEWQAKPVGFVSYGGVSGGLRAVEQLRTVFAELHAVTIRRSVSFHHPWSWFDEAGRPSDPEGSAAAAAGMLDQLHWWASALRQARAETPYAA